MATNIVPEADTHDPTDGIARTLDHLAMSTIAQFTNAISPATLTQSYFDWLIHLGGSPGKRFQLAAKSGRKLVRFMDYAARRAGNEDAPPAIEPLPQDHRFDDPAWKQPPYDLISQAFLLNQQWWHAATTGVPGVTRHHEDIVSEPGHNHRHYRELTRPAGEPAVDPDDWLMRAEKHGGSWWPAWGTWLAARSGEPVPPPPMGAPGKGYIPICDAPGSYVMER